MCLPSTQQDAVEDASDSGSDTAIDPGADPGVDADLDTAGELGADSMLDTHPDLGVDLGSDPGVDTATDAGVDTASDLGADPGIDAGVDLGSDTGADADAAKDTVSDPGVDALVDAGGDLAADTGSDLGTDQTDGGEPDVPTLATGFVRVVHLLWEHMVDVDLYINNGDDPITSTPLPFAGNTDAGLGHSPLPAANYSIQVVETATSAPAFELDSYTAVAGEYNTIVFVGTSILGLTEEAVVISDDLSDVPSGMHRLTLVNAAAGTTLDIGFQHEGPGMPVAIAGLDFADHQTTTIADGPVTIYVDVDETGTADLSFLVPLKDGEWSYIYLTPDTQSPIGLALHHVLGNQTDWISPQ